jgi:hypothetical protein
MNLKNKDEFIEKCNPIYPWKKKIIRSIQT